MKSDSCTFQRHTKSYWQFLLLSSKLVFARGQNKASPWANCLQNLARAHKMLRSRAQKLLKMLAHFNTRYIKDIRKTTSVPKDIHWRLQSSYTAPYPCTMPLAIGLKLGVFKQKKKKKKKSVKQMHPRPCNILCMFIFTLQSQ